MSSCKLIDVYQDVVDLKDQNLDNYRYLLPVENDFDASYQSNHPVISDIYNKVVDDESNYKNDTHIYESLYEFSQKQLHNSKNLRQPALPDRRYSRSQHTIKIDRKKNDKDENDAKHRVPLGDCSNWTLSSTCGEMFFENGEIVNSNTAKEYKSKFSKLKEDDDNNNTILHKLKHRKKQSKSQRKLLKSNKSSPDCDTNHVAQHETKVNACKTKIQLDGHTSVFFQHKQFKKNLEEDNPNLNPIRSADLGTGKMLKKDKDNKIKSKITTYCKT